MIIAVITWMLLVVKVFQLKLMKEVRLSSDNDFDGSVTASLNNHIGNCVNSNDSITS